VQAIMVTYCSNPDFAKVAVYAKPVGGGKKYGLSARFAEAVMPVMKNLDESTVQIYDDMEKQTWKVSVGDLETNTVFSEEVFVNKRTWRKQLRQGQTAINERVNTQGEVNYLVEATDDEVNTLRAALCSKVRRNLIIRHVPPDIRAECLRVALKTSEDADAKDPDAARKQIVDSFLKIGIGAEDLASYLGHSIRAISEPELSELRGVYVVIRDGEATWSDLLAEKQVELAEARKAGGLNKVKERVRKQREQREQKAQQPKGGSAGTAPPPTTQETGAAEGAQQPQEGGRRRASRRRGGSETEGSAKTDPTPAGTTATNDQPQQNDAQGGASTEPPKE
jgi:hypothetical protein